MPFNPYPGLRAFEYEEYDFFFGREGQAEEVLRRLQKSHFVAVVGTSGSGKSSLVRAGLLPLLYGGLMFNAGAYWRTAILRPGNNPIHNLARALVYPPNFVPTLASDENPPLDITDELKVDIVETILRRSSAVGLVDYVKGNIFSPEENLLIVVDQFEELFRYKETASVLTEKDESFAETDEKVAFVKLLLSAVREYKLPNVYVVMTMRSDYLGDCAQFRDLPETINDGQYLIPRMTRDQLREAIEQPAKMADKPAKMSELLVNRLLNDIGDNQDQLPILQHALMRTWNEWNYSSPEIGVEHYERVGGMQKALSLHADTVYEELSEAQQAIAEKMFRALTDIDAGNRETRRETGLGQICRIIDADMTDVIPVVEAFRREGRTFLMPPPNVPLDAQSVLDISHESLIRNWEKLAEWVADEAKSARLYRRLADDALLHLKNEVPYWSDPALQIALDWREKYNPSVAWAERYHPAFMEAMAFLNASEAARTHQLAEIKAQQDRELNLAVEAKEATEREAAAIANSAKRLRVLVAALAVMLAIMSTLMAVSYYYYKKASSEEARAIDAKNDLFKKNEELLNSFNQLTREQEKAVQLNQRLEIEKKRTEENNEKLTQQEIKLTNALKESLENEELAKRNEELAKQSVARANEALKNEKIAAGNELIAKNQAQSTLLREEKSRKALTLIERGSYPNAITMLGELVKEFDSLQIEAEEKQKGKWWTQYNLGTAQWKNSQTAEALETYIKALETLNEPIHQVFKSPTSKFSSDSNVTFVNTAFRSPVSNFDEIIFSKMTTYRKLGQSYRHLALNGYSDIDWNYQKAVKSYEYFFKYYELATNAQAGQTYGGKDNQYIIEARKEFGDTFFETGKLEKAKDQFRGILRNYNSQSTEDLNSAAEIRKKLATIELREGNFDAAEQEITKGIDPFEEVGLESTPMVTELFDFLAQIYSERSRTARQKIKDLIGKKDEEMTPEEKAEKESKLNESKRYAELSETYATIVSGIRSLELPRNQSLEVDEYKFETYSGLADAFRKTYRCERAGEIIREGLMRAQAIASSKDFKGSPDFLPDQTLRAASYFYEKLSDKDSAYKFYSQFAEYALNEKTIQGLAKVAPKFSTNRVNVYSNLIRIFQEVEPDTAIKFAEAYIAIRKAQSQEDYVRLSSVIFGYRRVAEILNEKGSPEQSVAKYNEFFEFIKDYKFTKITSGNERALRDAYLALGYYWLADFYRQKANRKDLAREYFTLAHEIFARNTETTFSYYHDIQSLKNLGEIEKENKNFSNSVLYFEQASAQLEKIDQISSNLRRESPYLVKGETYYRHYAAVLEALIEIKGTSDAILVKKRDAAVAQLSSYTDKQDKLKEKPENYCNRVVEVDNQPEN